MDTRRAFCAVNGAGETAAGALSASFALCVCCALAALSAGEDVLRFVDPFVGTDGTGNLVTLAERMTRFVLFAYVATKEADAVAGAVIGLLASLPKGFLKTLTFDNGKEFAKFAQVMQALGTGVYFAKPCHSWERGTNENRNGVVRKVLPKGRSFGDVTGEEMRRIDCLLNDRPLRCLNWRTPREAFAELLRRHVAAAAQ